MKITVKMTREFERDIAHYHVRKDSVERISRHLRDDPSRGRADAQASDVRHWKVGENQVSYKFTVFSAKDALILLLRIRPIEEPPAGLRRKALEAIDAINRMKSLFSGWPERRDENE